MNEHQEKNTFDTKPIIGFCDNIAKYLNLNLVKINVRNTQTGIFISENLFESFVDAYRVYLSDLSGHTIEKDNRKIIKKIFDTEDPKTAYLIEGKSVTPGYVTPVLHRNSIIPNFPGRSLAAQTYLHPRDPILSEIQGLKCLQTTAGLSLEYSTKRNVLNFDLPLLQEFQNHSNSREVLRLSKLNNPDLRITLKIFLDILRRLRKVKDSEHIYIPENIFNQKDLNLLRWKSFVFVIRKNKIERIYTLRGKQFVQQILDDANNFNAIKKINNFIAFKNSRNLGAFDFIARNFELSRGALCDFIEAAGLNPPNFLAKRFDVIEGIKAISKLIETADLVEQNKLPNFLKAKANRSVEFFEKQNWLFMVLKRRTILSIYDKKRRQLSN